MSRTSPTSLTFEVTPGTLAVHGGRLVVIEQRLSAGEVQVRDVATGVRSTVLVGSLRGREAGPLTELFDARDEQRRIIDEKDWVIARERERVVKELLARDGDVESHIGAASAALGVARRQIYTWVARCRAAAHTSALLDKPSGRPVGTIRLGAHRERLLRRTIDEHYLKQPRLKPEDIYKEVTRRCKAAGLREIARGTILARLRALDPETVARKRFGAKRARETVSAAPGTFVVNDALDVMQIDHTQVDLHVVDEEFRRPIGRPWITVATDIATRMISGIYLTPEAPSKLSVAMCLAHAVLPNETWLAERKISAEWPVWGCAKTCAHR